MSLTGRTKRAVRDLKIAEAARDCAIEVDAAPKPSIGREAVRAAWMRAKKDG